MTIQSNIQTFEPGDIVELFELDTTIYDGTVHRYTPSINEDASAVVFNGLSYTPIPMEVEGFDRTARGSMPQPTLRVADVSGSLGYLVRAYKDLVGAKVTRIKTFKKYLDAPVGSEPDTTAKFPNEVYKIERKSMQNKFLIEFTLASALDLQGLMLPKRLILKNICTHIYRIYSTGAFDYSNATCPYTLESGDPDFVDYYKADGTVTVDPAEDKCGKKYSDCVLRFPEPAELPTRAFPGVTSVRR